MENNLYGSVHEDKSRRGMDVDFEKSFELFTVLMSYDEDGIDIALPEETHFLLKNDKSGKLEAALEEAFRYLKPVIDKVAIALHDAIEEQIINKE